jgi:hypothetical protein
MSSSVCSHYDPSIYGINQRVGSLIKRYLCEYDLSCYASQPLFSLFGTASTEIHSSPFQPARAAFEGQNLVGIEIHEDLVTDQVRLVIYDCVEIINQSYMVVLTRNGGIVVTLASI